MIEMLSVTRASTPTPAAYSQVHSLSLTVAPPPAIGYRVGEAVQAKGVASAASAEMVDWAKGTGIAFVEAHAVREIAASVRVLDKAGFTMMAGDTECTSLNGRSVTLQLFRKRL